MSEGSEADPAKRIAELQKKRDDIDADIARVLSGDVLMLDDTAVKDRFQQFMQGARELLTDFREVEHNFRQLDRRVRERIALWEGSKGALLERLLALPAVIDLQPDTRTRRVHYDWMEAGDHAQRTFAALSQQSRRFLDDQAWLENRRIMDILRGIESKALALRDTPPSGKVMEMVQASPDIALAMERPLFTPTIKPVIADLVL